MQYGVPQFTDIEDKLIGPLTLKQFLMLVATGGLDLFLWSVLSLSLFFFLFALPITVVGLALAFGKLNGRPLFGYAGAIFNYFTRPQSRIFRREEPITMMKVSKPASAKPGANSAELSEPTESRLKKLAYLLDQKTVEEKELMVGGK